jgi:hypothetical protein
VFYCDESDKHVTRRLSLGEKEILQSEFKKNNVPPDGYVISIKSSGAVVQRTLTKGDCATTINVSDVPVKKSKKAFDVVLYKYFIFKLNGTLIQPLQT